LATFDLSFFIKTRQDKTRQDKTIDRMYSVMEASFSGQLSHPETKKIAEGSPRYIALQLSTCMFLIRYRSKTNFSRIVVIEKSF
jgi:hypothetical protein